MDALATSGALDPGDRAPSPGSLMRPYAKRNRISTRAASEGEKESPTRSLKPGILSAGESGIFRKEILFVATLPGSGRAALVPE